MLHVLTIFKAVIGTLIVTLTATWVLTCVRFRLNASSQQGQTKRMATPTLPYAVPGLGSTLSFANVEVGRFWTWLLGICRKWKLKSIAIVLSGRKTYVLFKPSSIIAECRSKDLSRYRFDQQLARNALGMSKDDAAKAYPDPRSTDDNDAITQHGVHTDFLLTGKAVNELTTKFIQCLREDFDADETSRRLTDAEGLETNLCEWLREKMFKASTTSLCGSELLKMHPELSKDFWLWDENLIGLLFGTPRIFAHKAYAARDRLVDKLYVWLTAGYKIDTKLDERCGWEPNFGSRVMRKRHEFYRQQGMTLRGQASNDLIFLAGILSNAIPATEWLLLHILSPSFSRDHFAGILAELHTVQVPSGEIDIPSLMRLPLLNSILNEVLRMYVDFIMVRQVECNTNLDGVSVMRGEQVMGSTWMAHRNEKYFDRADEFIADRFVAQDIESGKVTCSVEGLTGKFFPFGGGPYQCPGRVFARQEILSAVAIVLLRYEIEPKYFTDSSGTISGGGASSRAAFPSIKPNFPGNVVVSPKGDLRVCIKVQGGEANGPSL